MKHRSPDEIIEIGDRLFESMTECRLCPMDCRVNRHAGELGCCKSLAELRVSSANLHFGEEPPLSGGGGSGTVFLSGCSMSCLYCQNYPISQLNTGSTFSIRELKSAMLNLQSRGAENINFVTPDHMLPMILQALGMAIKDGLSLPIVYNCSGYQKLEILRLLEGIIDIYLVDMRYNDNTVAKKYSGCENYVETSRAAVKEMHRQVGNLKTGDKDLAQLGVIVRHLVLPGNLSGSAGVFRFLAEEVSREIFVSLMSQYFPAYKAVDNGLIGRRITCNEFGAARDSFCEAGLKNGYIQDIDYEPAI